uniref:Choline transporter-like protein n=1 Tax=Trieres chinensis TaxID=1514140 RepID=A0A7S2A6J5_TRICV|eukprot:CAMPEP_0183297976 /NCGR_PEP_ID=MMETSP0160_2-20130417/5109_1 /TAXON_ID=2839 ORGANISM="Odontella Sinensis, Strain Grunow 1884" /NCGR_SAMPLE_ID=MMETSP0160_2 /ASSEMBLY_ACC=CAM_ASM_000250 /LENGTH=581 /DNA_ID=CAMNT_0025459891 /DNA_START=109 /DNA_END=1854 /DNA_ORIENTATION=-
MSSKGHYAGVPSSKDDSGLTPVASPVEPFQIDDEEEGEFTNDGGSSAGAGLPSPPQWTKGTVQAPQYRDVWFAVAFVVQALAVFGAAVGLGAAGLSAVQDGGGGLQRRLEPYLGDRGRVLESFDDDAAQFASLYDDDNTNVSPSASETASEGVPSEAFLPLVILASLASGPALTIVALGYMSRNAAGLIEASLYLSIGLNAFAFLVALVTGLLPSAIIHAIFAVILVLYAKSVWHRIPYAAANLRSAITAVRSNMGVALVAFGAVPATMVWFAVWTFAFIGVMSTDFMREQIDEEDASVGGNDQGEISALGGFVIFMFLLSFYWTNQVINGVVRTTIAGVIGTWWFSPLEASSFCSSAVRDSLSRSTTYSFGSICFGSLIVAIIQVMRNSLERARNDRNGGMLRCIAHCLLVWIERLAEYFNKWAFIYVGLYGYSYVEAGKNVMTLFKERGWTAIISDNLVNRMLALVSFAIGLISAFVCVLVGFIAEGKGGWLGFAALLGFFMGLFLSLIMMGVLSSSVDAIIVCYAEAPAEFRENHPELHAEMEGTWSAAWPDATLTPVAVAVPLGGGLTGSDQKRSLD